MMEHTLSKHACERLQQRAVPPLVIEFLERFGSVIRCCGSDRLIFDKAAVRRLKRHLGGDRGLRLIERWLDVYAVVSDNGRLVTVAHQSRRHWRH